MAMGGQETRRWLALPLAWLLVAAGAGALALLVRPWLASLLGGGAALLWLVWVLGATLSPARADRRCPRCGRESLEPIRRASPLGVRCGSCGYRDEKGHVPHLEEE